MRHWLVTLGWSVVTTTVYLGAVVAWVGLGWVLTRGGS